MQTLRQDSLGLFEDFLVQSVFASLETSLKEHSHCYSISLISQTLPSSRWAAERAGHMLLVSNRLIKTQPVSLTKLMLFTRWIYWKLRHIIDFSNNVQLQ